jgi:hypothetical protein
MSCACRVLVWRNWHDGSSLQHRSIQRVAKKRRLQRCHLGADLVRPTGQQPDSVLPRSVSPHLGGITDQVDLAHLRPRSLMHTLYRRIQCHESQNAQGSIRVRADHSGAAPGSTAFMLCDRSEDAATLLAFHRRRITAALARCTAGVVTWEQPKDARSVLRARSAQRPPSKRSESGCMPALQPAVRSP